MLPFADFQMSEKGKVDVQSDFFDFLWSDIADER